MPHPRSSSQPTPRGAAKRTGASAIKRKGTQLKVTKGKSASNALQKSKSWKLSYLGLYRASPLERISLIKRGVPASEVKNLFVDLHIGQGLGFKALNLSTATVNKKAKRGDVLTSEESERVIGFAKLVGQLEAMIQESGDLTGFDARAWMARWLTEPLPAFGGARPADLIDTMEGQGLVSSALAKLQSGAYA
jgi:putative toxin-antitoxin system antitoxin component (TIGR02293 family)